MTTDIDINLNPPQEGAPAPPERSGFGRVAGVSGIVFAAAIIVSQFLVGDMPGAGDDASALREYFEDNRGPHQVGLAVVGLAIVPLILFAAGLVRSHRRTERDGDGWSTAIGAFFVYAAAIYTVGLIIDAGLLMSYDSGVGDELLLTLWDVNVAATPMMILGFGGATTAVALSVFTQRTRPAWYGGLGLVGGVSSILSIGSLVSDSDAAAGLGLVMLPVFMLWVVATGVFLYREA